MDQKKIETNDLGSMQVFLEGLGFNEKQGKSKCFVKEVSKDNETFFLYWDLRKDKPFFYVFKENEEKALSKRDLGQFEEYISFSDRFGVKEETKQKKSASTVLSPSSHVLESRNDAHTLMNVRDDNQVLLEIQGAFLEEFVYHFKTKEGEVTGLSWAGVKEVARRQGNVSVDEINITETPDTYRVLAKATDVSRRVSMYGVAEQSRKMRLKNGESYDDIHSLSKCVSRAQRNAIRALIPELTIKGLIEEYLKGGEVKK